MGKRRKALILLLVFCSMLVSVTEKGIVKADTPIIIKQSGDVESTELIERNGDVYRFTGNIYAPIIVKRNNIIIDGDGYTLEGPGYGWAIDQPTSNVTVKNLHIENWHTGILGIYNNNTILGNVITGCIYGIRIYAEEYSIIGNSIINNEEGILIQGGSNLVSNNNITNNKLGLSIFGHKSDFENVIVENLISFNEVGMQVWWNKPGLYQKIYRNNFIKNTQQVLTENSIIVFSDPSSTWNNGSEGNYWSDYNGTDNDGDGIGDTPYVINYKNEDIYPLMALVEVNVIPEFQSWIILPLLGLATLSIIICRRRLLR